MKDFRSYQLAVRFYRDIETLKVPRHLREQLLRAASSAALNLAEGRGRGSHADQCRFFTIAMGSIRECQAIFDLHGPAVPSHIAATLDRLAGSVFLLIRRATQGWISKWQP